jgi:hypothetical protein
LAKDLRKNSGHPFDANDYEKLFPYFMWIVRDFYLNPIDDQGENLTDDQYLEK